MSWTDERVALLKKLWVEGKTAAEIADTLGNVTRNAVIGKAHRLKLSNRVSPIQQNKKPVSAIRPAEKKQAVTKILTYDENREGIPLIALGSNHFLLIAHTHLPPRNQGDDRQGNGGENAEKAAQESYWLLVIRVLVYS